MSELKYDPELPFVVRIKFSEEILGRFQDLDDATQSLETIWASYGAEVIDTTPKPKIPEGAEYITWSDPYDNGEERIAMRYGHPANKVWRVGVDTLDELDLLNDWIGDAEVTVLVRKEES